MYASIPYVCDAIADFVRRLAPADSSAIYTFSRNLFRATPLTQNHHVARAGLSNISAGDDTALFNSVLLTVRDAARIAGRKAIVVFSNGPDNASVLGPEDVGRVAENEGIPIYVISTRDATQDRTLFDALQRLTSRTGGKLYCARNWQQQAEAFTSVREDIGSSYTAYYYPAPNANHGYRSVRVEIVSPKEKAIAFCRGLVTRPGESRQAQRITESGTHARPCRYPHDNVPAETPSSRNPAHFFRQFRRLRASSMSWRKIGEIPKVGQ